jgi:hypothetical protein
MSSDFFAPRPHHDAKKWRKACSAYFGLPSFSPAPAAHKTRARCPLPYSVRQFCRMGLRIAAIRYDFHRALLATRWRVGCCWCPAIRRS